MKTDAEKGYTILIGHELDNEASIVRFDVSNLIAEYGSGGTFAIYNRIPSSSSAYPIASTNFQLVDGFIEWTITDDETTAEGNGECQLKYTINGKVIMSTIYKTNIKRSVLESGTTPTPWTPWVNQLEDIRDEAIEAQEKAEEAVEKYPRIDQTTKHWLVYDAENDEWDDTGIVAEGKSASMYVVTMTRSGATYSIDKTFSEIKNAHETNQVVVLKYDGYYMQLCALSNSAVGFSIYIDSANFAVTISSSNVVSVTEYEFYTIAQVNSAISAHHDSTKQNTLVSGTNIKTINGSSILGSGDMTIGGGGNTLYQHNILITASRATTSSSYLSLSLPLITDSAVAFTASTLFAYINAKIHDTSVTTNGISCSGSVYNSSQATHCVAIKVSGYDDSTIRVSYYGVEGSGLTTRTFDTSSVHLFADNVFQL